MPERENETERPGVGNDLRPAAHLSRASRLAQGLTPKIRDSGLLARIAELLRASHRPVTSGVIEEKGDETA